MFNIYMSEQGLVCGSNGGWVYVHTDIEGHLPSTKAVIINIHIEKNHLLKLPSLLAINDKLPDARPSPPVHNVHHNLYLFI